MKKAWMATVGVLCLAGAFGAAWAGVEVSPRARRLHDKAIVVDTHCDVTQRMIGTREPFDLSERSKTGHMDIPRAREGGLDAVFFSIYMSGRITGPEAVERSLRMIDAVHEAVRTRPNDLLLATTAADIRRAARERKIAALMGMEGGHMINDSLANLRMYARLGVRYLTLTHSVNTNWGDSSTDTPKHNGLTDFGKQVVLEMNRLGVMVDISHVSDKTFYDALEVSKAPLLASHSSCRAICNAPRNMTDDMIRALAQKGGVIQITFVDSFLSQELRDAEEATREERQKRTREEQARCAESDANCRREAAQRVSREFAARMPKVSWEKIIEHIDHAVKIAGIDHVGLGTDFDGATMPEGMDDASYLPRITEALLKKGYSERDITKILGGNTLRLMEQVEQVSRDMQAGRIQ
jgi:membrane dipeptidase